MAKLLEQTRLGHAELFFHVFAHVEGTRALPASVHSPRYVDWARRQLGDPASRTLADDAAQLASAFPTHAALASIQLLARLFEDTDALAAVGSRSLSELAPDEVASASALFFLQRLGKRAELAFCALTLELPYFLRLPPPPAPPLTLAAELDALTPLAPGLAGSSVGCVRALDRCGRVWGREIWVGHPSAEVAPSVEHVAWQAAHEATVALLAASQGELKEREVEALAIEQLTLAAHAAGKRSEHTSWLETTRPDGTARAQAG
ncbi:MAG TPA: hypothetical protein VIW29_10695 [Polyangiaceae bacterium]